MNLAKHRRQQPVLRHRVEDSRLAHQHHQDHRRQPRDRADLDDGPEPHQAIARGVDAHGNRIRHVELGVLHQSGEHQRHRDVEHRTDGQRGQDPDRHVLLRIPRLLRRRGHRIEADVREEDHARTPDDAVPAEVAVTLRRRNERDPVLPVDERQAKPDEQQHDRDLHDHNGIVERRRLPDAHHQHGCHDGHDHHGRHIQHRTSGGPSLSEQPPHIEPGVGRGHVGERRAGVRSRDVDPQVREE